LRAGERISRGLGLGALTLLAAWGAAGPASAQEGGEGAAAPQLFRTADRCMACHNGMVSPGGEDVSIGFDWRASMMANSARDPYWQAAVRRETIDHPSASAAIQDECAKCHMPMARYEAHTAGGELGVFVHVPVAPGSPGPGGDGAGPAATDGPGAPDARATPLAQDGVSCTICHQISSEGLGTEESFVGGFHVDTTVAWGGRTIYGPFAVDTGRVTVMRSASSFEPREGSHVQSSEMCATCHTLYTHALGPDGEVIGELPEQVPYLEWRHSDYPGRRSCQACHMPVVRDSVAVTGVLGLPRAEVSRHVFRGGNFFMLRILNRYLAELGVRARPEELTATVARTEEHLRTRSARLSVERARMEDGILSIRLVVENLAGHKLPTAYPSRRAWLHLTVRDAGGRTVFESGALEPDGRIVGNDNDADPARYEPHHRRIEGEDQVQIYEAIMVGPDDGVTTGLLTAVRFVKDNRVLPTGFDKATAPEDVAVHGGAADDGDFTGGSDRVLYAVAPGAARGPFTVEAELWYQPIGFRWAHNLDGYGAFETERFLRYYESMSEVSGIVLARARATAAEADRAGAR